MSFHFIFVTNFIRDKNPLYSMSQAHLQLILSEDNNYFFRRSGHLVCEDCDFLLYKLQPPSSPWCDSETKNLTNSVAQLQQMQKSTHDMRAETRQLFC